MKRIISLMAVVAMLLTFCVTASAATATMVAAPVEIEVAEGTQDVVMDIVFNMDEEAYLYGVQLEFVLPTGVTLKAVDWTALSSICPSTSNDDVKDLAAGKASFFEGGAEGTTVAVSTLTVPCTFTVDTTVANVYDIAFTDSTGILDVDTFDYINANRPATTITVKEAASAFEPETIKGDAIAATATDIVLPKSEGSENTHRFTNVAIFNAEIGAAVKYSETGFIWVANGNETENKFTLDGEAITGDGTFAYSVIMAGIPDDVTITAKPYYVTAE